MTCPYRIISSLISCLYSVVEMAALWTAAKMPILVHMLLALSGVTAFTTTGRGTVAPSEVTQETSTSVYTKDLVNGERNTEMLFGEQTGGPEVMLNEKSDGFVKLFNALVRKLAPLTSDIGRKTSTPVDTDTRKRYNGWLLISRILRSDLGKRTAVRKLTSLTSDIGRKKPMTVDNNIRKRYNGWAVKSRFFRSDLGKRSIRTSSKRVHF